MKTPSYRAAKRIVTTCGQIAKFTFTRGDFDDATKIIEQETHAQAMADALEQSLEWLNNLALIMPPGKFLDACPNDFGRPTIQAVLDKYQRG